MSYSQLKAFHSVALYGGFSRASEKVFLTQPALSEHVRRLEQDHDVLLFRREKKRVFLTPAGSQLFDLTKRFFEVEHQINDFLQENRSEVDGVLRIIVDSASHISDILGKFQAQYPRVFVSMQTSNTDEMISQLRSYNAELAVGGSTETSADLKQVNLGSTPIIAIAAKGVFPKTQESIPFSDLPKHRIVFREKGSKTRQLVEQEALRRKLHLKPVMEVEGREAMRDIVGSGAGIGFVSEAEFGNDDRLVRMPIGDADLQMQESLFYVAQRADLRLIRTFVEFLNAQPGNDK
ncbi:LysR family transcriptional regulator [Chromatiales bacterium (ex Bugula neritina AB1)]|nr:LysR family transcriptional regulator [Chromatiales bacterium (ex Bugula neritina AB1)]